ncbi:hypothetical protein EV643_103268 [Kribbella sp. VKM Ac-2527]|uniref:Uncharacterized protein n=1 Tax=Kribbella caucasensis TaxID=2512215 RepID=A0A4R6KPK9_9ACTN|nr:hypothetical protein [Kribbella sp. VKM Ac-2527]TDO51529.1 hypothetical protein EV643_103268 [Kribbella sp. VKM Ac-2527]
MDVDLEVLIAEAASSGWAPGPSRRLADGIESRIVVPLSSRLRAALGHDEAAQLARVIAWERCLELAVNPPEAGVSWGYLANLVRWRLKDAVRSELLRRQRHPLCRQPPDRAIVQQLSLGSHLERIISELELEGLPATTGRRLTGVAADGPPYYRAAIIARLRHAGASGEQAEGLAWLLRGGAGGASALARLAQGQKPEEVFTDPVVRRWVWAAAGRDLRFFGRPSRLGHRRAAGLARLRAA